VKAHWKSKLTIEDLALSSPLSRNIVGRAELRIRQSLFVSSARSQDIVSRKGLTENEYSEMGISQAAPGYLVVEEGGKFSEDREEMAKFANSPVEIPSSSDVTALFAIVCEPWVSFDPSNAMMRAEGTH